MSFLKTGLVQKIRTFAFLSNRTFPKNPDFHQKSLHIRVRILSKPLYMTSNFISDSVNPKFFKSNFLQNACAESKFQLKIWIQRKISRRIVCVDIAFSRFASVLTRIGSSRLLFSYEKDLHFFIFHTVWISIYGRYSLSRQRNHHSNYWAVFLVLNDYEISWSRLVLTQLKFLIALLWSSFWFADLSASKMDIREIEFRMSPMIQQWTLLL